MGERHQIFIIARRGGRYRCLAVVHSQWLYGKSALERCNRLLAIFADASNRLAIEQELAFSVVENDKVKANAKGVYRGSPHPFPFIATCLYIGTVSDPDVGRLSSRIFVESPSLGYNQGDNNTGITVIDISDLDHLRYCFVWFDRGHDKPETARKYLGRFYNIDDDSDKLEKELQYKSVLEALEKVELIPVSSLRDCWPDGTWIPVEDEVVEQAASQEDQSGKATSKSLVDMSVKKLFDELLSSGDDADIGVLDHPLEIPSMRDALLGYCRQNADAVAESPFAVKILARLLDGKTRVDLYPYRRMAPDATRSLLKSLRDVRVLNLSGTRAASDNEVADTLAAIGHDLDELYILAPPDREVDDPTAAVRAVGKQPFTYHKLILASVFTRTVGQRSWMGAEGKSQKPTTSSSPDLYGLSTSFPVIQVLVKGPGVFQPVIHESFFLGDGFISPVRFVTGILNTVRGKLSESWMHQNGSVLAHAFASAPSSLKAGGSLEMFAPPAEAYWIGKNSEGNSAYEGVYSRVRDLTPDAWTAVLAREKSETDGGSEMVWFKIALLRSNKVIPAHKEQKVALEDVEVVDLETFLAKTASSTDVADLKQAMENVDIFVDQTQARVRAQRGHEPQAAGEPRAQIIRGMEAAEAVGVVQEVFNGIGKMEKAREQAYRWD